MALIVALLCVTTLWTDFQYRKVPNLVLLAALGILLVAMLTGLDGGSVSAAARLAGFGLGLAAMLPAYLMGRMGAGDVKFFAVVGAFIGPSALWDVWLTGGLLAFAHAAMVLLWRRACWSDWMLPMVNGWRANAGLSSTQGNGAGFGERGIPYAAYLAMGVLAWMTSTAAPA